MKQTIFSIALFACAAFTVSFANNSSVDVVDRGDGDVSPTPIMVADRGESDLLPTPITIAERGDGDLLPTPITVV